MECVLYCVSWFVVAVLLFPRRFCEVLTVSMSRPLPVSSLSLSFSFSFSLRVLLYLIVSSTIPLVLSFHPSIGTSLPHTHLLLLKLRSTSYRYHAFLRLFFLFFKCLFMTKCVIIMYWLYECVCALVVLFAFFVANLHV